LVAELIMLDGQILNGSDRLGDWKTNSLVGWWDSPDPKGDDVERSQADGDFDLEVFYQARYITITGRLLARSHDDLHHSMNRFSALVQKQARLQVSGHGHTMWADVKRASGLTITPSTDTFAQWQVRLKAPNPRKYGDTQTFAFTGTGELFQYGNYRASPVFTISGNAPLGYTINGEHGEEYKVTTALVPGAPHTINFANARLRIGSTLTSNGNGAADVWDTAAGSISRYIFTSAGSVSVTATVTDTFI
jgi:hypothetical protein